MAYNIGRWRYSNDRSTDRRSLTADLLTQIKRRRATTQVDAV